MAIASTHGRLLFFREERMKNLRVFAKPWFRVLSISLVLGAALLTVVLNFPASAEPPDPPATPSEGEPAQVFVDTSGIV